MKIEEVEGMFYVGDIREYRALAEQIPNGGLIVEVGCLYGKSICSIADIIKAKNLSVICCDVWDSGILEGDQKHKHPYNETHKQMLYNFTQNTKAFGIRPFTVRGTSFDLIPFMAFAPDMVFLDNDHGYQWVSKEVEAWWPLIKKGGILAGHDYSNDFPDSVVKAVNEFSNRHGLTVNSRPDSGVWSVKK